MKKHFLFFGVLICFVFEFFVFPYTVLAVDDKLKFGLQCSNKSQCASNDCENAKDNKAYCDCSFASDCEQQYGRQAGEEWACVNGGDGTLGLDYCRSNLRTFFPQGGTKGTSNWDFLTDSTLGADEIKKLTSVPELKIKIPGLTFSKPKVINENGGNYLSIPILGEYIKAAYRYGIAAAGIIAVVIIINAGFLWVRSAGSAEVITAQKSAIEKAVIGLIVSVASYTILYFINPNLTKFDNLKVQYIEPVPVIVSPADEPASEMGPSVATPGDASNNNVPYFAQYEGPWAKSKPGSPGWPYKGTGTDCATIHQRGCGTTSLAMVLAFYGWKTTPLETSAWGLGCNGGWQSYPTIYAEQLGLKEKWPGMKAEIFSKRTGPEKLRSKILSLMSSGKPLVYNCAPCQGFNKSGQVAREYRGHYVVLTGLNSQNPANTLGTLSDDKIFLNVNDPGRNANERIRTMSLEQVVRNLLVVVYVDKN